MKSMAELTLGHLAAGHHVQLFGPNLSSNMSKNSMMSNEKYCVMLIADSGRFTPFVN